MNPQVRSFRWPALWLAIAWSLVAAVVYLSLAHIDLRIPQEDGFNDKYAHMAAYAVLMFWFAQIYTTLRPRIVIALGLAALGITLEFLQAQTGYRSFEYGDMLANAAGVALGWTIAPPRTPNVVLQIERLGVSSPR